MKKGQAALEFLMTYGWAVLAAIIIIGVLAYFGVFSPGKYVPNTCTVTAPFGCNAWNAKPTGINLELKNNGDETYSVNSVAVSNCGTYATPISIVAGGVAAISVSCTLTDGASFRGDIAVTYRKSGSTIDMQSTGSISQRVAA